MKARLLLVLGLWLASFAPAFAWVRSSDQAQWPAGTLTMQLRLGTSPTLSDGRTWEANATEAMQIWNGCMRDLKFAWQQTGTTAGAARNGFNEVFFAGDVYGEAWGSRVLAVAVYWSSGKVRTEADVLFNRNLTWDAYRGSLRYSGGSGEAVPEFRRVALHELGHVLGLGHPDENGQYLSALMNSTMSEVEALTEDDGDGIGALYGRGPNNQILPPQIDWHPYPVECYVGDSFWFQVAANGRALSCKWQKDGVDIPSATGWSYSKSAATLADAGAYTAVVSNEGGSVTSNVAQLKVLPVPPPTITGHPYDVTVVQGARLSLSSYADGRNVKLQWRKDNVPIAGATSSSLEIVAATFADAGVYTMAATNDAGVAVSNPAKVTVTPAEPPRITYSPSSVTAVLGGSVSFHVGVTGSYPLSYQWYRDGQPLPGGTWDSLSVYSIAAGDEGAYSVTVRNAAGEVASEPVQLRVVSPPLNRTLRAFGGEVRLGESIQISSSYSSFLGGPRTFQWYRNGTPIAGATAESFTIAKATLADAGDYLFTVTNSSGMSSSTPARVSVVSKKDPYYSSETPALGTWVDVQVHADVVYVLYATPGRIERYDMAARKWLPTVMLPASASAFRVDVTGVYVAFGKRVARFGLDLTGETTFVQATQEARQLVVWRGYLYAYAETANPKLEVFTLETGAKIASADAYSPYNLSAAVALAPLAGRLYAGVSGYYPLEAGGTVGSFVEMMPYTNFPQGRRVFLNAEATLIADGSGVLYRTSDFGWVAGLGGKFQDIIFFPGGGGVVLNANRLQRLDADWRQTSEVMIDIAGDRMFVSGGAAFVFAQATTTGGAIGVARVGLDVFLPRPTAPVVDATDLDYSPDEVLVDRAGNVLLASRLHRNVFRWSTAERRYLAPVTLAAAPSYVTYAAAVDSLVLAYPDGWVKRCPLPDGFETGLAATFAAPTGLAMAGDVAVVVDQSGAWASHWTVPMAGGVRSRVEWNYESSVFGWSPLNRRLFHFRENMSPNDLHYEEIGIDGTIGARGDSPYHGDVNCAPPIRISPDGQLVLLGSGEIYSGGKLELVARLANRIDDAAWAGGTLTTVRAGLGECELQQWHGVTFAATCSLELEGYPLRLAALPDGKLLLVTLVHRRPRFHVLEANLAVLHQSSYSVPPTFTAEPVSTAVPQGGAVDLTVGATGTGPLTYQWYRNGVSVSGGTAARLSVPAVGPLEAGFYDCVVSGDSGSVLCRPAVVGPTLPAGQRTAGSVTTRDEWQDIRHPNGNVYDQFLLSGHAGTFSADPGQIARMSYLDHNGSIVQVEMSGAGAITVVLDPFTDSGPLPPQLYNQTGVDYMKGKATIILAGADQSTHFTIYSVGTATNPGVTYPGVAYAGWADVAVAGIVSTDGQLGGIHQGNVRYGATNGYTGLYAPTVRGVVGQPVVIHEIAAGGVALGQLCFAHGAGVQVKIAGGSLAQPTGDPLVVDGLAKVTLGAGQDSCGRAAPAQPIGTRLVDPNDNDVTGTLVGP